ncbi:transporter substrate-binding domain-containing protein [Enterovirga aerilata]|uniref:Transporter substrate-binding domain-containing protein n=1 Tax=Enterovirga aerilata TaxID=2730920 RepID=A0A849I0E5_9HYPH|nr:transporter substrate-binding domain-containing protein [Enterovirga sp. DB1703]NNM70871.1 transporter substrate-binding domain-containing protein [Enterovirga sp. DB1703]
MRALRNLLKRWFSPASIVAGTMAVSALAGSNPAQAQASRLDEVMQRGKLIVSTFGTSPPLCFTDEKGQLVGFDIDIARLIAKSMFGDPNKVDFVTVTSEGRWPSVLSGRADFGIASTTVYPDRAMRVAFTRPYMDSGISLLVRKDAGISTIAELNNSKFTLANLSNPQMVDRQKRFLPDTKTLTFDTPSAMFLAVKTGQAQAMQFDSPVVDWYGKENSQDLIVLPEMLGNVQNNAIFLKPGDFAWWLFLDTMVQELTTGSRYNEYVEVYQKWFGRNPPPQRFYGAAAAAK